MSANSGRRERGHAVSYPARGTILTVDVIAGITALDAARVTFSRILKGIQDRAELEIRERPEVERIKIVIHYKDPSNYHPETGRIPVPRPLRRGDLYGTILVYPFEESAVEFISRRIMTVMALQHSSRIDIDTIDTDDAAISEMVRCLHSAGHTRIGFVSWDEAVSSNAARRRFDGYARALHSNGLSLNWDWIVSPSGSCSRLNAAQVVEFVARNVRESSVTAWVCSDDHEAYHLMQSLQILGIHIPRDFSITGFDAIEAPTSLPRVTSMRVPYEHIGSSALTRLINRVMYPSSPQRTILLEPQLVPGETIAARGLH